MSKSKPCEEINLTRPDGRSSSSPENGKKGGRPPAPEFMACAAAMIGDLYSPKHCEKEPTSSARASCATTKKVSRPTVAYWRGSWLHFNGLGWKQEPEDDIRMGAISWLESKTEYGPHATPHYVTGLLEHMRGFNMCGIPSGKNMPMFLSTGKPAKNWMGFSNGKAVNIWDWATGVKNVCGVTPDLFMRDYVAYPWDPHGRCPTFLKYLCRSLPSKKTRELIQEMAGLLLSDCMDYELFFYLYGPTARNGKTVFLEVLSALVGKQNVSHVGLGSIMDRFEAWPLSEAKVNIWGDMATDTGRGTMAHVEGLFKDLISGGNIEYQKKGKDKFDVPCRARFVFAGNSLPTFVDRSDAIWERLRVVHFPVQIPASERDPHLAEKIIANEMPGVLQWALQGLGRVIRQRGIPDNEESLDIKLHHRTECDHEKKFIEDVGYIRGTEKDYIPMTQVLEVYKRWMADNGYVPKGSGRFYQRLESLIPGIERINKRIPGIEYPVWSYRGLKIG